MPAEVRLVRRPLTESVHLLAVAVADPAGRVRYAAGPVGGRTFWRSSAKPFQALGFVRRGGMALMGDDPRALAVMCASHSGTKEHVARVRENLERVGLSAADLLCGSHPPLDPVSARALAERGEAPSALHSNCSGKHSGMLAFARLLGAPTADYLRPDHPVQAAILDEVSAFTGVPEADIPRGVDGCGAPVFGLSVVAMAIAFARLADPSGMDANRRAAAGAIAAAMTAHPFLVAGQGRFDTDLMTATGGRLVSKSGAEGVQCVAIPKMGLGVAVKVLDGAGRASAPAVLEALRLIGALTKQELNALSAHARPAVLNVAGRDVGQLETDIIWEVAAA